MSLSGIKNAFVGVKKNDPIIGIGKFVLVIIQLRQSNQTTMNRIITLLALATLITANTYAQTPLLTGGCATESTETTFDQEVTWVFDLTGISGFADGDSLWFYSWEPTTLNESALLTHCSGKIYKLTFIPEDLYNTSSTVLTANGDANFWFNIQATGETVVAAPDYPQKEIFRQASVDCDGHATYGSCSEQVTSIEDEIEDQATIAPNPFSSDLKIQSGVTGELNITLYDLAGAPVYSEVVVNDGSAISISPDVASGMYLVSISSDNTIVAFEKVIKE